MEPLRRESDIIEREGPPAPPPAWAFCGPLTARGREVHVERYGGDGRVVVLEAGIGDASAAWDAVRPLLPVEARTFAYDRPGVGASPPTSGERTALDLRDDLAAVLDAGGVTAPVVLVAHSGSGLHAQLFAAAFPGRVAALVLVESAHRAQLERFRAILEPLDLPEPAPDDPPWLRGARGMRLWATGPGLMREHFDLRRSAEQLSGAPRPDVPRVVVTGRLAHRRWRAAGASGEVARAEARLEDAWMDLQADLVGPDGVWLLSPRGGHALPYEDPATVARAVRVALGLAAGA